MVKIQKFHCVLPPILLEIPHPVGSVSQEEHLLGTAQPFPQSFPVQSPPQFQCPFLPTDNDLVHQEATTAFAVAGGFVSVKDTQLQFMPFYALLLGFVLAPTGTPIADLATVGHQYGQRTGRLLRPAFLRRKLIPALRLFLGVLADPLHQRVQGRIINLWSPGAGHLRGLLIGTGGRYGKAELLGVGRGNLLMRP